MCMVCKFTLWLFNGYLMDIYVLIFGHYKWHQHPCIYIIVHACKIFYTDYLFIFRDRGREGERGGKKHCCERETSIGCLSCVPWPGTEPVTQACALTRNQTGDLLLCGTMPNQMSHTGQGCLKNFCKSDGQSYHMFFGGITFLISNFCIYDLGPFVPSFAKCLFISFAHFSY